eukprot:1783286-Alexandrium_andersonii.AAC.1
MCIRDSITRVPLPARPASSSAASMPRRRRPCWLELGTRAWSASGFDRSSFGPSPGRTAAQGFG